MTTLWSGRFDAEPDPAAFEFVKSFRFDRRLFDEDVTGSIAWARALDRAGLLPHAEADQIKKVLKEIRERGRSDPPFVHGDDQDIHSFVERQLARRLGDQGR